MRTDTPMTTDESLARQHGWALVSWDAAYAAACDSVTDEMLHDVDPDDDRLREQVRKSCDDAVTNTWHDGLSHDAWVSAALRRLR